MGMTPAARWRPKLRFGFAPLTIAVISLTVAVLSALAIGALRSVEQDRREAETELVRLRADAIGAASLSITAGAYPSIGEILRPRVAETREFIETRLARLEQVSGRPDAIASLRGVLADYLRQVDRVGNSDEPAAVLATRGLLVWGRLNAEIDARIAEADADARAAARRVELGTFAILIAGALVIAGMSLLLGSLRRRKRHLEAQVITDPVTGLLNHRAFHERLEESLQAADRVQQPLGIVMLDLDHFKEVNDTHGHPVGDRVLAEMATRIASVARTRDHVARIGGEEFAWILPDSDERAVVAAATRLVEAIRQVPMAGLRVTASLGVAEAVPGESVAELVERVDAALYQAKREGRDRLVAARPQETVTASGK